MTLHSVNEHFGCNNYATDETSLFFLRDVKPGETIMRNYLDFTLLVFLYSGDVEIDYGIDSKLHLKAGNVFLLPKNFEIKVTSSGDVARVLLCKFTSDIKHYHQIKREELFMYLRAGYTKEELAMFFSPVLGKNLDFKDFVLTHYKQIFDVREFAQKANMSQSTFNRRFKESFNDTALKWLLARKSESILNDIVKSDLTFAEISEKYRFSSPSYFVTFCKKHYGKTAAVLRREGI